MSRAGFVQTAQARVLVLEFAQSAQAAHFSQSREPRLRLDWKCRSHGSKRGNGSNGSGCILLSKTAIGQTWLLDNLINDDSGARAYLPYFAGNTFESAASAIGEFTRRKGSTAGIARVRLAAAIRWCLAVFAVGIEADTGVRLADSALLRRNLRCLGYRNEVDAKLHITNILALGNHGISKGEVVGESSLDGRPAIGLALLGTLGHQVLEASYTTFVDSLDIVEETVTLSHEKRDGELGSGLGRHDRGVQGVEHGMAALFVEWR